MPAKKGVSIVEVANLAGVSIATVSRVLNNYSSVRSDTIVKVKNAMVELGYVVRCSNVLEKDIGKLIVINLPNINNSFYHDIVDGIQSASSRYGFSSIINYSEIDNQSFSELSALLKSVHASGLITLSNLSDDMVSQLNSLISTVQCCEHVNSEQYSFVTVDDIKASKNAIEYLFSTGRKDIALINGPPQYKFSRHRRQGFILALENAGIPVNENRIIELSHVEFDMALSACIQLFCKDNRPDAIFAVSDVYAAAAVRAAKKLNFDVPKDISVIGFDNIDISYMTIPSITTINQPKFQMGYLSCEILIDKINNKNSPVKQIVFDTELIIREST